MQSNSISLAKRLFQPVDNSPLIVFRVIFGFLLFYHCCAAVFEGTVYTNFIQPPFTFTYIGFEYLQPLPGKGMYFYFGLMAFFSLLIMAGAWYRFAIVIFSLLWTGIYLMQKSGYNNHYYLVLLLCWIMVFLPANRYFSIDVKRRAVTESENCYRYCIWIFIAQVAIVYFFAAIGKLSADWFSGKYIAIQFSRLSSHRIFGIIYSQKWFQLFICYSGFLFDLLIVPLLLRRKTRKFAFIVSCLFHLFNSFTFRIGIFPYLSIALNIFFFNTKQVRRFFFSRRHAVAYWPLQQPPTSHKKTVVYVLAIYFFLQCTLPLRSLFFPGNVFWTEEGYRLSWKMMMRTKSGTIYFKVVDPATNKTWKVDPGKVFTPFHVMWLSISPDIIWQYAQKLKKDFLEKGIDNVEVYAIGTVSLNRSKPMPMIDTTVNLAAVKWQSFRHAKWITKGPE